MMRLPRWARLLPITALEPLHPNIELIDQRKLLEINDSKLPDADFEQELHPDSFGPYRVADEARLRYRRKHDKRYKQIAAGLCEKGMSDAQTELDRVQEELEALQWLQDQCVTAENNCDHHVQLRPTFAENEKESRHAYLEELRNLRAEIARVRVHLRFRQDVLQGAISHLRSGGTADDLLPDDPPYSDALTEYLKLAYYWYLDKNHCEGDRPTELWEYLAEKTGNSTDAPRMAFKRVGWYDPEGSPTPAEHTRERVMNEGEKFF